MKISVKPIIALVSGPFLLSGLLASTAQAALTPGGTGISGSSVLADADGVATGPEAITVNWSVVESLSDVYTYSYDISNPAGDVLLGSGLPEIVDDFTVAFPAAVGAIVANSETGGTGSAPLSVVNNMTGVNWLMLTPTVAAGTTSGWLTFQSLLAPSLGNASATDANPPSPWASTPDGQEVPVPGNGSFSVPDSASTMSLLAGMMLLLPFRPAIKKAVLK